MNNYKDADLKLLLIDLEADNTATGGKQEKSVQPERLSEGDNIYCVYWIHKQEHTNFYNEGYIGITCNFKERFKQHKKSKKDYIINRAKNKYGWETLLKDILIDNLTIKEALFIENKLRSKAFIGWNNQIGGNLGVEKEWYKNKENKLKHSTNTSKATKLGIALNDTHEARVERSKKAYQKNKQLFKTIMVGSKNGKAILNETQVYEIRFNLIPKGLSNPEIAKKYNVKPYVIGQIRKKITWKHVVCDSPDYK